LLGLACRLYSEYFRFRQVQQNWWVPVLDSRRKHCVAFEQAFKYGAENLDQHKAQISK